MPLAKAGGPVSTTSLRSNKESRGYPLSRSLRRRGAGMTGVAARASMFRAAGISYGWFARSSVAAWSRRQDETGDPRLAEKLTRLSGPGLVMYGISITFASVDWVMSLQPAFRWVSCDVLRCSFSEAHPKCSIVRP